MAIKLTPERIRLFTCPADKEQVFLSDSGCPGLYVRAAAAGKKTFVFQTRLDKKSMRVAIGNVNAWSIEQARVRAREMQRLVDMGIDPRDQATDNKRKREAEIEKRNQEKTHTLGELCNQYVGYLQSAGKVSAIRVRSTFKYIRESELANRPANSIRPIEIANVIRAVVASGKTRTGGILRSYLLAAYNAAMQSSLDATRPAALTGFLIETNPVAPIPAISINPGDRTLSTDELRLYLGVLGDSPEDIFLKIAIYGGGQRLIQLGRTKLADWNSDTKTLRLMDGKGRRKTPREHLLPLGPKAAAMVEQVASLPGSAETLMPASARMAGCRISAIVKQLELPKFDTADIRRTVETMMAGMGISRDTRAQLLSHGLGGVQGVHYDKHTYTEEKRAALIAWENRLEMILSGQSNSNVVQLNQVA